MIGIGSCLKDKLREENFSQVLRRGVEVKYINCQKEFFE
jgi:hypothetical protein